MKSGKEHSAGRQPAVRESGTVATGHRANNVMTPHSADPETGGGAASPARTGGKHGAGADAATAPGGALRGSNAARRDGIPDAGQSGHGAGHGGGNMQSQAPGNEQGARGSGKPPISGAGELADDRPGRDAPKGS